MPMTDGTPDASWANQSFCSRHLSLNCGRTCKTQIGSYGVALHLPVNEETRERGVRQELKEKQKNMSSNTFQAPCSNSFLTPDSVFAPDFCDAL